MIQGAAVFQDLRLALLEGFAVRGCPNVDSEDLRLRLARVGLEPSWSGATAREFEVAEGFAAIRCAPHHRVHLGTLCVTPPAGARWPPLRQGVGVYLTVYPDIDVACLMLTVGLEAVSVDDAIFVAQCLDGRKGLEPRAEYRLGGATRADSLQAILAELRGMVRRALGSHGNGPGVDGDEPVLHRARVVEIRVRAEDPVAELLSLAPGVERPLYGLAVLDEGWRHVPRDVAAERLSRRWRTRNHLWVLGIGPSIVLIDGQYLPECGYRESQKRVRESTLGACEEYFQFEPSVAGLNHGPLLMAEACSIRLASLRSLEALVTGEPGQSRRELIAMREELRDALVRLRPNAIPEVNLLEALVADSMGLESCRQRVEGRLDEVEALLAFQYSVSLDRKMLWLTVLGTCAAVWALLQTYHVI